MNILLDPLPESVIIHGKKYPVNWGFRTFILIEICIFDTKLSDAERVAVALNCFYGDDIPSDLAMAHKKMMWFYRGGEEEEEKKTNKAPSKAKRCYCFEKDAAYIFSAFRTQYGIDLQDIKSLDLHWWKFKALFESLDEDHKITKIMGFRTIDTKGMSKEQKKYYEEMKRLFALEDSQSVDVKMALAKRNADMRNYVQRRMTETKQ